MHQVSSVDGTTQQRAEPAASVRTRRRPALAVGAVLLILLGAAGGAWIYLTGRDNVEVVVARVAIARGEVMVADQLTTVHMPPNEQLRYIPATELPDLVGQRAAHDVAAGSLIGPDAATPAMVPGTGRTVVGLSLPPGAEPAIPLQVGDRVRVVLTEPAYACAAGTAASPVDAEGPAPQCSVDVIIPGTVVATARDEASGQVGVSVEVGQDDAPKAAAGAALGRVALVLDSRDN
ncbi:SAF domain-containing protein [Tessaracoccus sp. MC1756]|uniref:SAF domain-containing protein n=1 Tax=Tessaracoccus sp. MC1756 TaxID=2760311 RepID=UPI001601A1ED|nr:SAF domain-containing protein [Tessaracoccus sp. MC1756]MBB1510961.1 hypothetical protein [Tessaracoccus sp. MC1756]